jgi:hypothetical protein
VYDSNFNPVLLNKIIELPRPILKLCFELPRTTPTHCRQQWSEIVTF